MCRSASLPIFQRSAHATPRSAALKTRAQYQQMLAGPASAIHAAVAPQDDHIMVTKHRVGAFAGTDLDMILRAKDIATLILFRISTSGVVLSTVRHAAAADYRLIVIKDCCADGDPGSPCLLAEQSVPAPGHGGFRWRIPRSLATNPVSPGSSNLSLGRNFLARGTSHLRLPVHTCRTTELNNYEEVFRQFRIGVYFDGFDVGLRPGFHETGFHEPGQLQARHHEKRRFDEKRPYEEGRQQEKDDTMKNDQMKQN
jgi:hypothetical protein